MSYFDVPAEPEPYDGVLREWYEAPSGELGTEIAVNHILATSSTGRITVRAVVAFSTGFKLHLVTEWALELTEDLDLSTVHPHSDHYVRVAIEYANGNRTTNMDDEEPDEADDGPDGDAEPPSPPFFGYHSPQFMTPQQTAQDLRFWVWSIPADGDATVVCEWVAAEIPVVQFTLSGHDLRNAAQRSQKLW